MLSSLLGFLGGTNGPLSKVLDLIPNKNERARAEEEFRSALLSFAAQQNLQQMEINKQEAQHASLFVAGWRPAVGWACCFALAWQYVLQPMLTWLLAIIGSYTGHTLPELPTLDTGEMITVLMGLLGLAGYRTFEKVKGEVDRSSLREL